MEKKNKITNASQFDLLIEELNQNPRLAKGFSRGSVPSNFKKNWEDISTKLNAFGPPTRDSDGWQKVWRDLKFKAKKQIAYNKAECNATGGGRYSQMQLSPLEESVASLMQFQKQLTPDGFVCGSNDQGSAVIEVEEEIRATSACALPVSSIESTFLPTEESFFHHQPGKINASEQDWFMERLDDVENICPPESSSDNNSKKRKRQSKENKNSANQLFEMHNDMQKKVLTEISHTMNSIKNALKDTKKIQEEKLELLKIQNENEKEIKRMKREKLKMLKRKNEREEELFHKEMQIKKIELEIKNRVLQTLNDTHATTLQFDQ